VQVSYDEGLAIHIGLVALARDIVMSAAGDRAVAGTN
jgi:hypothetical protein